MVKVSIALIFLGIGLVGGIFIPKYSNNQPIDASPQEIRLGEDKFTNPLLECEVNSTVGDIEHKPSKNTITSYIADEMKKKNISHASVYYRDLNNGPWFGINEKENFSPASLLKLPVLMAYLKQAEKTPDLLGKKLLYHKINTPVVPTFAPDSPLENDREYTISELLEHMIIYSDNNALILLEELIDNKAIDRITEDLGIETATDTTPEDFMSVKSYASLFRVLFNASYLNREMSEKALGVLTQSAFTKGIVFGLPKDLTVAHKFGERELDNGVKQLHDCGIVYMPRHPYLLCIMTRGTEYAALESVIATISKNIYEDLSARYQ